MNPMASKLANASIVVLVYVLIQMVHALPRPILAPQVESRSVIEYATNVPAEKCPAECAQFMKIYGHNQADAVSLCEGQCKETGTVEWALAWDNEGSNSTTHPVPLAKAEPESKILPDSADNADSDD